MTDHHDAFYTCSPKALARAEVAIARARHESARGRPVSAQAAIEQAEAAVREGWKGSGDTSCLPDVDGDQIPDRDDTCPSLAEDFDAFQDEDGCPDPDNDGDGVKDVDDQCLLEPGTPANRGCPVKDGDGDGVMDPDDSCPLVPGPRINRGCPIQDADKDGVSDDVDRCPAEAGPVENGGCPYALISITEDRIQVKQKVFFQTGKAGIQKVSFELLDEVARAILDHPKFRIRIEGHTDSVGRPKANVKLSQARADAVRMYLIGRGVAPDRLQAAGLGDEVPLDDNSSEAGRAVNRRVEFHILEQ
jgi:outer membrane protein OmpA-like peptidoglycan-associated protein